MKSLKDDFFLKDSELALVGKETNISFGIGDLVLVKLSAVNRRKKN